MPIRVLIVDPHEITRAGIKITLSQRPDLELVGAADSLNDGLRIAHESQVDVVIIDPRVVPGDSFDAVMKFRDAHPELKILVFGSEDCAEFAQQITASGAEGYLIKAASVDEIAVAIRSINLGRIFISHTHHRVARPKWGRTQTTSAAGITPSVVGPVPSVAECQLSQRELEVLALLVDGMTNKQAAERLFLSVKTVETYRSRIMRKHGLSGRAELVQFARRILEPQH